MPVSSLILDYDDFDALRQLIRQHCGIWLDDGKITFLQTRLAERLRGCNISSAQEYYYFLKYDARGSEEIQRLIDAVTVNETWFFREAGPLEAWREVVLPDLIHRGGTLHLWSAGCATGEEPYTLAMLVLEAYPDIAPGRLEILATDISQRALQVARAATYDPYSLRRTEPSRQANYFQATLGGQYTVCEKVRQRVHFGQANLIDPSLVQRVQAMDVVLCRNVIIYMDDPGRQATLINLHTALKPGGYLILGHSESLIHVVTPFEVARVGGQIMYRKRDA